MTLIHVMAGKTEHEQRRHAMGKNSGCETKSHMEEVPGCLSCAIE